LFVISSFVFAFFSVVGCLIAICKVFMFAALLLVLFLASDDDYHLPHNAYAKIHPRVQLLVEL
jgi:hypothetical protein